MQVLIKPSSKNIDFYRKLGIENYLFSLKDYATESNCYFTINDIKEIKSQYRDIHLFVSINKNIKNQEIEPLKKILKELDFIGIDAVFFYDQAIILLKEKLNLI